MKVRGSLFCALACCLLLASCRPQFNDPQAFKSFVRSTEYPYRTSQEKGTYLFQLRFVTPDEMALNDLGFGMASKQPLQAKEYDARLATYSSSICLQLNVSWIDGRTWPFPEHILLDMDGNVTLQIDDHPPVEPTFVHPERNFGLGPTSTVALVFPNVVPDQEDLHLKLLIHEFGLETGDLNFELDIDRTYPSLSL